MQNKLNNEFNKNTFYFYIFIFLGKNFKRIIIYNTINYAYHKYINY